MQALAVVGGCSPTTKNLCAGVLFTAATAAWPVSMLAACLPGWLVPAGGTRGSIAQFRTLIYWQTCQGQFTKPAGSVTLTPDVA